MYALSIIFGVLDISIGLALVFLFVYSLRHPDDNGSS